MDIRHVAYCWQYGSCPLSECTRTVKPRVIVQLLYGMWPFWRHYGYSPVSVFTSSVNPSVNVQWIYGIGPYCWHYGYWPVSECSTIRQVECEWTMDIWSVAVLLTLRELAHSECRTVGLD